MARARPRVSRTAPLIPLLASSPDLPLRSNHSLTSKFPDREMSNSTPVDERTTLRTRSMLHRQLKNPESTIKTALGAAKSDTGDPEVHWIEFLDARHPETGYRKYLQIFAQTGCRNRQNPDNYAWYSHRVRAVMALLVGEDTIDEVVRQSGDPLLATVELLCSIPHGCMIG
jgi:hypothetical protein